MTIVIRKVCKRFVCLVGAQVTLSRKAQRLIAGNDEVCVGEDWMGCCFVGFLFFFVFFCIFIFYFLLVTGQLQMRVLRPNSSPSSSVCGRLTPNVSGR